MTQPLVNGADMRGDLKDMLKQSVLLAALENIMKLDTCPVLRAAARARYLDLTDGGHDNDNG